MATIIYKGIVEDALEMSGLYFKDNKLDYKKMEEMNIKRRPAKYRNLKNNDYLNKEGEYTSLV